MRTYMSLESLGERLVPSATQLDLTSRGAVASAPSGAIVEQTDAQPTGTGVIHSFLRVQGAASGGKSEQGYNTDARPLQFDENKSPQFTRSLRAGDVPTVHVGGIAYREFLLDINQRSSSSRLSVDEVRLYLANQPNLTGYDATAKTLAGGAAAFDLDAGGDVSIMLDARLNSGSGSGDMFLLVPETAFAGATADTFVYLYSKMGDQGVATANGGFEEWAVRSAPSTPAGTASLSGYVYVDADISHSFNVGDGGLANVTIHLTGIDDLGKSVDLFTTTAADGSYSFTGLRAGTYSLTETLPPAIAGMYLPGTDSVGTINGTSNGSVGGRDLLQGITLGDGQSGINYNFGELPTG